MRDKLSPMSSFGSMSKIVCAQFAVRVFDPRHRGVSHNTYRALVAAGCCFLISASTINRSYADDGRDLRLSSAVVHLNGVRIHEANCGKVPDEDLFQRLASALRITQTKRKLALREYVNKIHTLMLPTAVKECTPQMLDAYLERFREKLDELRQATNANE